MGINKRQLLMDLQRDLKAAEVIKLEWDGRRESWVCESAGKPYGNEVEGKSKIVSKDIKKQLEWLIPRMTDPFLSTQDIVKCNPVTYEDAHAARQSELLLNTQFCRKFNRYNFINKAARVLATEGTVVIHTGWEYEEEVLEAEVEVVAVNEAGQQYVTTEIQTVTKPVVNKPTAVVCRNEDIYLDPTCMDDMDKCQFIIHRYETDISTLTLDGRYSNLDKLAHMDTRQETTFVPEDTTRYNFGDAARKKMVVYEYWGNYDLDEDGIAEPIVCAWVGNVIIRLEDNPYPDKKPPFIVVPFVSVPFQMFGESLAEAISDNQKVKTAITRGIIDNMARSNNAQVGIRRGALDLANRKKFLMGNNFEFNGTPADFWQGSYNQIPSSAFDMMTLMNNEIESQTGIKSFSGGITGASFGNSATAARGAMDATSMKAMHLVRNMAENMVKPLMRKWLAYCMVLMSDEEVIRITNEEFVPVRRDDLAGNVDIDLTISTQEDNSAKSQELSFLLQTVGPNEDPTIRRELMAQIIELMRMPDQAKKLREYQPQPDPVQEQLKKLELDRLQLENDKLRSEIERNRARAGEDQVDVMLKQAKVSTEQAKARMIHSDSDIKDLNFLEKESGVDYEKEIEKKQLDNDAKLAMHGAQSKARLDEIVTTKELDRLIEFTRNRKG